VGVHRHWWIVFNCGSDSLKNAAHNFLVAARVGSAEELRVHAVVHPTNLSR